MRTRTEEINVRLFKSEKNLIRRNAKKCGMNLSEYLRTLGTNAVVKEAPSEELMLAYQKVIALSDSIEWDSPYAHIADELEETGKLLLKAYHGKEDADGSHEDLGHS
ncbi:MAG: hypothetical protein MJ083_01870 [Clostridia bacterium]|nr:hypothetical protein [Clostridia bacterium]